MVLVADAWLREILTYPVDPQRADMLIVIRLGIRRLAPQARSVRCNHLPVERDRCHTVRYCGRHSSWRYVLHADLRFVTMIAAPSIPAACSLAIVRFARNRDWSRCLGLLLPCSRRLSVSPDLKKNSMSIGHTLAYWPLLPLLAYLVDRDRSGSEQPSMRLLIAARSTMIATAPVPTMRRWPRPLVATAGDRRLPRRRHIVLPFLTVCRRLWARTRIRALRELPNGHQGIRVDPSTEVGAAHHRRDWNPCSLTKSYSALLVEPVN